MSDLRSFQDRKAQVLQAVSIGEVVERFDVKLSGSASNAKRRGKCPFHGSNSASLSLTGADRGDGHARCFGCGWSGDVFKFVQDLRGWPFVEALAELERMGGVSAAGGNDGLARGLVARAKDPSLAKRRSPDRQPIESIDMGRWIWRHAHADTRNVRRYFAGRGVPETMLADGRLVQFRYMAECPCWGWPEGTEPRNAKGLLTAGAIVALVRQPVIMGADGERVDSGRLEWVPVGVHVTYLNPDGTGTMARRKPWAKADEKDSLLPKRRMLGPVGHGCVLLGEYRPDAHLWIGEGNETVLSAMALGDASDADIGIATLSLDNLQGQPRKWRNGIWPLFDVRPDPEKPCFLVPRHRGQVTGLVDSDMSPLRGMKDPRTGQYLGEAVVDHKGGPIVRRPIDGMERARICSELIVKGWRGVGCEARAMRAPIGMDFNDAIQEAA